MKITCQSCQAKYTIADEKVVGKTVKIKCKKCGATIVVNGNELAAAAPAAPDYPRPPMDEEGATRVFSGPGPDTGGAPGADEWTVNVADDDQRTMSTGQIQQAYASGTVTPDTYVWRDGMADWLPLSGVPELVAAVSRPAPAAGGAYAPPPEEQHDNAATVAYATSPFHQPGYAAPTPAAGAPAPAPAPAPSQPDPAPAAAARRAGGGRGGVDLFGGSAEQRAEGGGMFPAQNAPPPRDERLVGERNENSVLFSLSALTASENANRAKGGGRGDEGVIDMRSPAGPPGRRDVDDIMSLGGGGFQSPMLAPPPLLAPVVEAPPSAPAGVASSMPAPMMAPAPEKKSSMVGLIAGVALGIAIVGGAAIYFLRPPPPPPAAQPETTAAAAQPSAVAAVTPPPTPSAAPAASPEAPSATPSASAVASAAPPDAPSAKPSAVAVASKAPDKPAVGGPGPAAPPPAEKPKPAEKPAEPPAAPTAAPAAAAGGNEFNRGAAASALGGAAGAAKSCKKPDGPTGTGRVKVTFAPSGNVTSAVVDGPPFSGTSVGGCIAAAFRGARVPPFDGAPVVVSKSFTIN